MPMMKMDSAKEEKMEPAGMVEAKEGEVAPKLKVKKPKGIRSIADLKMAASKFKKPKAGY